MTSDPYEALQDDLEAMSLANAGLLVEVAELTAIVESVRWVRGLLMQEISRLERSAWGDKPQVAHRLVGLRDAVALLDEVEGL